MSHPSVPVNSVKDLIALARSKPDALTYATAGPASNPHIAGELLKNMAKIKLLPVHYISGGPSTISTLSGETQLRFSNGVPSVPYMRREAQGPRFTAPAQRGPPHFRPARRRARFEFTTWHVPRRP